jgi:hypothetical protein
MDEQNLKPEIENKKPVVEKVVTEGKSDQAPVVEEKKEETLVKKFPNGNKSSNFKVILVVFVIIILGVGTGYALSSIQSSTKSFKSTVGLSESGVQVGDSYGSADEKTFRDQADGVIVKGGVDGEGSHHLMRPGGESQNVYLTSSVVDLDLFIDHKIKIWGETFSAQKAGWLMDVGRVEVIELNAEKPFEE